jgi:hypothetical protein
VNGGVYLRALFFLNLFWLPAPAEEQHESAYTYRGISCVENGKMPVTKMK